MPFQPGFLNAPLEDREDAKFRAQDYISQLDQSKSLYNKVLETMQDYCEHEKIDPCNLETILLTGGALQLKTNDGQRKLRKTL